MKISIMDLWVIFLQLTCNAKRNMHILKLIRTPVSKHHTYKSINVFGWSSISSKDLVSSLGRWTQYCPFHLFINCTNDNPLVNILWNKVRSFPIHPFRAVPLFSCTSTQSYTSRSLRHVEDDLPSGVTLFHLFVGFVCLHKRKLFVNNRSDLKYKTRMVNFSFIHSYSIKIDICFPSTVLRVFSILY